MIKRIFLLILLCFLLITNSHAETLCAYSNGSVAFSGYYDNIKLYPNNYTSFNELVRIGEAYFVECGTKCIILERNIFDSFYDYIVITSGPLIGKKDYVCYVHVIP